MGILKVERDTHLTKQAHLLSEITVFWVFCCCCDGWLVKWVFVFGL